MGYTKREFATGANSLTSFDSPSGGAGGYQSTAQLTCNDEMVAGLTAIKGAGFFVQGNNAFNSGNTITSLSAAFTGANTAGNCIVVDFMWDWLAGLATPTCADSQGNSYTAVFQRLVGGGLCAACQFVAFGINAGANTVTVSFPPPGSGEVGSGDGPCIAIHEYTGGTSVDVNANGQQVAGGPLPLSVTTTAGGDLLHLFYAIAAACTGSPSDVTGGSPLNPPFLTPSWLLVNEPPSGSPATGGITDRSKFLFLGQGGQHTFNLQQRQRGVASYTLVSSPGDPSSAPADYLPTLFQPIYLFDENASGWTGPVFAGLIQDFTERWVGTGGLRFIDVSAVSLEAVLDTIYVDGTDLFINETCGFILTTLWNKYEVGSPVFLGIIQAGAAIPTFNPAKGTKLSDIADQLATTSLFVWGVNPQTQQLYFYLPSTVAAPFNLTSTQALWDSISEKFDGADYRNRQGVKGSFDAFPHSMEYFAGAGQQNLTLMRPVEQVVTAYITLATCNTATGSIPSGNFAPGDTVTIGPFASARIASHIYGLGGQVTYQGYVQQVTTAGTSGAGAIGTPTGPTYVGPGMVTVDGFNPVMGGVSTDGTVFWTNEGPTGLGAGDAATSVYTAVAALDNTQYGQFLIGSTGALTLQNLIDCINATVTRAGTVLRGVTFSLPTWENSQCNALAISGTSFVLQQKAAGTGWIAGISTTSANFSWSSAVTKGGSSPQGSVGPNEPGTITIQVYQQGTSNASPGLAYTQGSANISLATPLNAGTNLNVEYTRTDGNVIEVENTSLVTALAAVSHGTGKIQQFTDQSSTGLIQTSALALLQFAQEALAAYDVIPQELEVILYQPGLLPGQVWTWALAFNSALNGSYFITEVKAELVPVFPWLDRPSAVGAGHYRYTIRVVNLSQLQSYMDFWRGLGGGSSGGGAGSALVATSGGAAPTGSVGGNQIELETNGTLNSSQLLLNLAAGTNITLTDLGGGEIQITAASGASLPYAAGGGTANAQTATYSPAITSLTAGLALLWLPSNANTTTTPTFAPNGLTAKTIVKAGGAALAASDLTTTAIAFAIYDGTSWELQNPQTGGGGGTPGGSNTQVQYNNSSAFGGITGATTDGTNLSVTTQPITDNTNKAASDAFVQAVVANAIAGTNPAVAVQAATTTAGDTSGLTYNNGVSGIGATFTGAINTALTIDGFTFTTLGQRLLVKNDTQTPSGAFNGVYSFTQLQTSLLAPVLTRALDYDQPSDINNTGAIPVVNGTANASTSWLLTSQVATVGVSPLAYTQFSVNPASLLTNPMTTKGDVIVGATSGVPARLGVGSDKQVLTANSGATDGIDWENPPYDVIFSYPGSPPNAATVQIMKFTRAVTFPSSFTGSQGVCGTNPTATATYTIYKNGGSIGTAVISTGGSFTFSGAGASFAVGDILAILTPATDATLANVSITLSGTHA